MDAINLFKKEFLQYSMECEKEAKRLRADFVSDYPIDSIKDISLFDFMVGIENRKTFCSRIRYDMQVLASMGNAFPSTFGVYYKKGYGIKLSKTYERLFGDNSERAFESIKGEIVDLLRSVEKDDFSFMESSDLNSTFICKLIIIYYPEKVFPVCTKSALENYCRVLGMNYDEEENMLISMQSLLNHKENLGEVSTWSDYIYMRFGDWLWDNDYTIKDCNIVNRARKELIDEATTIEEEFSKLHLLGTDKAALIKQRINQGIFRKMLLSRFPKCCLCGVSNHRLLVASHIKPWKDASPEERVDIDNGFIMCPNHDKVFDGGLISFDDSGRIIISDKLDSINRVFLNVNEDMTISLFDGNKKYLEYHRNNIFDNGTV